jgi:hypothetical protein
LVAGWAIEGVDRPMRPAHTLNSPGDDGGKNGRAALSAGERGQRLGCLQARAMATKASA